MNSCYLHKKNVFSHLIIRNILLVFLLVAADFPPSVAQDRNQPIKSLVDAIEKEKNDSLKVIKIIDLTRLKHKYGHDTAYEYKWAQRAIDIALEAGNIQLYASALDNMGLLHRYHKSYREALAYHRKAFDLVEDIPDKPINKMIYSNNAGYAARYDEQFDLAVNYYLKSLRLAEEDNNLRNIGISSNGLGNSLSELVGRDEEALKYFKIGLKAERERNDSLGIAMNLLSISGYYIKKGQFDEAMTNLKELETINGTRKDSLGIALTNEFYGDAYLKQGMHIDTAKKYYLKALAIYKIKANYQNEAGILYKLGMAENKSGSNKNALAYFNSSLEQAKKINLKSSLMESAYAIANIYRKMGNYKSALDYFSMGKKYEDSIALSDQVLKIAGLTSQFELDKKEEKISLLEKEQRLKQELIATQSKAIGTQRLFLLLTLCALTVTIILGILQYRSSKIKRLIFKQLQDKEKQLLRTQYEKSLAEAEMIISRMQINPHFIFNCLNAIHLLIIQNENKKAGKYLIDFSKFIRKVLELPKHDPIPLDEELELVRNYLSLEEKRFNDDFSWAIYSDEPGLDHNIRIPPLLLQPFVENAIWHGVLPSDRSNRKLTIDVKHDSNFVNIIIDDNGIGRKKSHSINSGTFKGKKSLGMEITQKRIEQFNKTYDCKIDLKILDKENDSGTQVLLTIDNTAVDSPIKVNNYENSYIG